jgi:hypothetical protein
LQIGLRLEQPSLSTVTPALLGVSGQDFSRARLAFQMVGASAGITISGPVFIQMQI